MRLHFEHTLVRTPRRLRRRGVVFALAGGAAIVWRKPVVDVALLPAHAQMSIMPMSGSSGSGSSGSTSTGGGSGSSGSASGSSGSNGGSSGSSSGGSSSSGASSGGASGASSSGSSSSSGSGSTSSGSTSSSGTGSSSTGGGSSSGSGSTGSSSGSSSGSGSSGGGGGPKVEPKTPSVTASTLTGGACVSGCPGSSAFLMVDIYDSNTDLIGSYETSRLVAGDACVDVTVKPEMYGIASKIWPRGYMFVIAVNVPQCGLSDQVSGYF